MPINAMVVHTEYALNTIGKVLIAFRIVGRLGSNNSLPGEGALCYEFCPPMFSCLFISLGLVWIPTNTIIGWAGILFHTQWRLTVAHCLGSHTTLWSIVRHAQSGNTVWGWDWVLSCLPHITSMFCHHHQNVSMVCQVHNTNLPKVCLVRLVE